MKYTCFHFVFPNEMVFIIPSISLVLQVLGGFDASNYVTERKWATASDGTQIPLSVVYRKDLVKLDGSDPLLLYGYGSYEVRFCYDVAIFISYFFIHWKSLISCFYYHLLLDILLITEIY